MEDNRADLAPVTGKDPDVDVEDLCFRYGSGPDIDAVLDLFGLDGLSSRHPQSLSGGEKQRLVIACAMIRQPDILILDEPTSGLDGKNLHLIAGAIRRAADNGTCVLLISHDLELISRCCDGALHLPLKSLNHKETDYV